MLKHLRGWFCLSILICAVPPAGAAFDLAHDRLGMFDHQMGMSVTWGDYDNNGYPDIFVNGYRRHPEMLYQNMGGTFRRMDTEAGVADGGAPGFGSGWADYDNDGDLDLYAGNSDQQVSFLYRNDGPNETGIVAFTEVAALSGMGGAFSDVGVAWADYDGDGYLDLFAATASDMSDLLYRNLGNGTFENVAARAGLADTASGSGVAWADYDNDGDLDLYVNNASTQPKFLYRNNGNGTFTDVAEAANIVERSPGQGAAWADYDNDGDLDLYVANFDGKPDYLYRNKGDGTFEQVAEKIGLRSAAKSRGAAWGDCDNDGDFDLFVCVDWGAMALFFRNNGNGTFTHASVPEKFVAGGWMISAAWADYDMDGRLDLYVSTQVSHRDFIYQNLDTGGLHWIKVNPLTAGPRDGKKKDKTSPTYRLAIGAWVEVDLDGGADFAKGPGRYVAATVGAGDGYASQAVPLHFGAGKAKTVDVRVRYPTGQVVKHSGVAVDQVFVVKDR